MDDYILPTESDPNITNVLSILYFFGRYILPIFTLPDSQPVHLLDTVNTTITRNHFKYLFRMSKMNDVSYVCCKICNFRKCLSPGPPMPWR